MVNTIYEIKNNIGKKLFCSDLKNKYLEQKYPVANIKTI